MRQHGFMKPWLLAAVLTMTAANGAWAADNYQLTTSTQGLVFSVDGNEYTEAEVEAGKTVTVTAIGEDGYQAKSLSAVVTTDWGSATARRRASAPSTIPIADVTFSPVVGNPDQWTFTMPAANLSVAADYEFIWGDPTKANGSENTPFEISTTDGLDLLARRVNGGTDYKDKFFVLVNDLDYSKVPNRFDKDDDGNYLSNYQAISGYFGGFKYFCGTFDGGGHTVKGITIVKKDTEISDDHQGLFGRLGEGGSVSHVTLDESSFNCNYYTGGIAGDNCNGNIIDCHVTASVSINASTSYNQFFGGIAGQNSGISGLVAGCTSAAHINGAGSGNVGIMGGGIVGYNTNSTIKDCLYLGQQVGGNEYVGAIAGYNDNGNINNCYFTYKDFKGYSNQGTLNNGELGSAIGYSEDGAATKNVGLARTITLGDGVAIDGTVTNYAEGVKDPAQYLTAYATGDDGFVLALTTTGKDGSTTYYSTAGAEVGIKYTGTLPTGTTPKWAVSTASGDEVTVSESNGQYSFTMPADNVSVSVMTGTTVTVGAQSWATYYGGQAVKLAEGVTNAALYTISEVGQNSVTLSGSLDVVSKQTPLLVWNGSSEPQTIALSFTAEPATPTAHAPQFTGTLDGIDVGTITTGIPYVLYNNEFVRANGGSIGKNRCYIVVGNGNAARQMYIGGETTSLYSLSPDPSPKGEGRSCAQWYDLQGRKVSDVGGKLHKGVYIVDGQKRVVK